MPAATSNSSPTPDHPTRSGRLLSLVRKLINYCLELIATVNQPSETTDLAPVMRAFGSADLRRILARILCGLQRAQALEDRIVGCAARLDAGPKTPTVSSQRAASAARPAAPCASDANLDLAPLPTPEQIAAMVRRQPIGAVIADICRDLGIMPSHSLWRELHAAITEYNGSYTRLMIEILGRPWPLLRDAWPRPMQQAPALAGCRSPLPP